MILNTGFSYKYYQTLAFDVAFGMPTPLFVGWWIVPEGNQVSISELTKQYTVKSPAQQFINFIHLSYLKLIFLNNLKVSLNFLPSSSRFTKHVFILLHITGNWSLISFPCTWDGIFFRRNLAVFGAFGLVCGHILYSQRYETNSRCVPVDAEHCVNASSYF